MLTRFKVKMDLCYINFNIISITNYLIIYGVFNTINISNYIDITLISFFI
jgi:hypothetical protein